MLTPNFVRHIEESEKLALQSISNSAAFLKQVILLESIFFGR